MTPNPRNEKRVVIIIIIIIIVIVIIITIIIMIITPCENALTRAPLIDESVAMIMITVS